MILKNPDKGSPIKTRVGLKIWELPVGSILEFDEDVGMDLLARYGFLERVEVNEEARVLEIAEGYKCSRCDYINKVKVGVLGHIRGHGGEKVEVVKAEPIGDAKLGKTIWQARAERLGQTTANLSREEEEAGLYGQGLVEER